MGLSVVCPIRSVLDDHARALAGFGLLDGYFVGTRRGTRGIPGEATYLNPLFGLWVNGTRRVFSNSRAEWLRTAAHPLFDRWAAIDVKPGGHVISSFGYANHCYLKARSGGGKTFTDAGNSHPAHFWEVVEEEHRRWNVRRAPYPRHWNESGRRTAELSDYILSPSSYVSGSFRARGFDESQILYLPYPVDLSMFSARPELAIPASPLRVTCTGSVSLRKGFPYLLEAIRLLRKEREVVLCLVENVESSMLDILPRFSDVPIEWTKPMGHAELAEHLKGCHVFALASLEDGFALTVAEALACGLPAVVSEHTGAKDLVTPGVNGEIVPIRDPQALAAAIVACHERQLLNGPPQTNELQEKLSFATFEQRFADHLRRIGLMPEAAA